MTLVVNGLVQSSNGNGFTTPTFDSSGAHTGYAHLTCVDTNATLADNKGNTWTEFVTQATFSPASRLFYCESPVVGTGHTFTVGGASQFGAVAYQFWTETWVHDGTNARGAASPNGPTLKPGSTTPSAANGILITGVGGSGTKTIDLSFTISNQVDTAGGAAYGQAMGYKLQTTAQAEDPTWGGSALADATIGAFIPGAAAATSLVMPHNPLAAMIGR